MVWARLRASRSRFHWPLYCRAKPGTELVFGTCLLLSEDMGEIMGWRGERDGAYMCLE